MLPTEHVPLVKQESTVLEGRLNLVQIATLIRTVEWELLPVLIALLTNL